MPAELTLFACPKAFVGHIEVIQRNAINSWIRLKPKPDVLLIGNDKGTAEVARELNVRHIPDVECTPAGTPLVSGIFKMAKHHCNTNTLAYINADIILLDDFSDAFHMLGRELSHNGIDRYFLSCQRTDIDMDEPICFHNMDWNEAIRSKVAKDGVKVHMDAIDIFLYSNGLFHDLPAFALGRTAWDNYLVWKAREEGASIIDATDAFLLIHQCHDYGHAGSWKNAWQGEEAKRNQQLAAGCTTNMLEAAGLVLNKEGIIVQKPLVSFNYGRYIRMRMDLAFKEAKKGNLNGAEDHIEDATMWLKNLQESKSWFEQLSQSQQVHIEELKDYIEGLEKAKLWLAEHSDDQEAYIEELEKAKLWLAEHSNDQEAWLGELQKGKDWLDEQWNIEKTQREDCEKTISILREEMNFLVSERDRLQKEVNELQNQLSD